MTPHALAGALTLPALAASTAVALPQSTLFTFQETEATALAGSSVALWEDLDGDGRVEWVVGAPLQDTTAVDAGRVRVFSGATGLEVATFDGAVAQGRYGQALANVGDLDGDGLDELALGAQGERVVRVFSGATQSLLWSRAEPTLGRFGGAVARAGDVNADGTPDVIVGAPTSNAALVLSGIDGSVLFTSSPPNVSFYGFSVAAAGDIDSDGYADVVVGAPQTFGGLYNEGAVAVLRGPLGAVAHIHRPGGVNDRGMEFGFSVAPAGDVDGDGFDDYAVGARYYGALHFIDYNFVAVHSGATHGELRRVLGGYDQWFGASLANVGDIDLDGHTDLAIGNPLGQEVVVWSPVRDVVIHRFVGPGFEDAGGSVAGGRDVDGDGFLDLVQGTPYMNWGSSAPGRATVFTFGCPPDAAYSYCVTSPNSASPTGARIARLGSTSLGSGGLRLFAYDCPTSTFGVFFHGDAPALVPSGFGRVCAGGALQRLYPAVPTGIGGVPSYDLDYGALGVVAGDTRFFQVWLRDNVGGVPGYNFSDGLRVTFCP